MSRELELALPPSAVEGSAKAKVTIIGKFVAWQAHSSRANCMTTVTDSQG